MSYHYHVARCPFCGNEDNQIGCSQDSCVTARVSREDPGPSVNTEILKCSHCRYEYFVVWGHEDDYFEIPDGIPVKHGNEWRIYTYLQDDLYHVWTRCSTWYEIAIFDPTVTDISKYRDIWGFGGGSTPGSWTIGVEDEDGRIWYGGSQVSDFVNPVQIFDPDQRKPTKRMLWRMPIDKEYAEGYLMGHTQNSIPDVVAHDRYIYASLHYMDYTLRWVWVFIPANQSVNAVLVGLLSDGERELGGMDEKSWQVHEEVEPTNFLLEIYAPNSEFRFRPSERSK